MRCLLLWPGRVKGASGWLVRQAYLEVWHQPTRLQVQRVLVEAQPPVHHLLVVELKLNVAARRNMDLGLEGLHVLSVGPARRKRARRDRERERHIAIVSLKDAALGFGILQVAPLPDDPCRLPSGPGLSVQVPGHRLLLDRAHKHDAVHVPAAQGCKGQNLRRSSPPRPPPPLCQEPRL